MSRSVPAGLSPGRVRAPRVAELVAKRIRDRILTGQLGDGQYLPPLEVLAEEFGVSGPSIREAERILEEELGRKLMHQETHLGRKKASRAADTKYTVDAVAAMVILREYLSRQPATKERE